MMPIKRADKNSSVFMCMRERERRREKKVRERAGGRSQRVSESVDVHSLRYTSIYSKFRAARRENCFVSFLFMPGINESQKGGEGGGMVVLVVSLNFLF